MYYFMIWRQENYFVIFKFFKLFKVKISLRSMSLPGKRIRSLSNFPELAVILQPAPEKTFTTHFTNELVSSCVICLEEKLYLHRDLISVRAVSV